MMATPFTLVGADPKEKVGGLNEPHPQCEGEYHAFETLNIHSVNRMVRPMARCLRS